MGIKKVIGKFLWHRSRRYKKITKLMDEMSPEELEVLKSRIIEMRKVMGLNG